MYLLSAGRSDLRLLRGDAFSVWNLQKRYRLFNRTDFFKWTHLYLFVEARMFNIGTVLPGRGDVKDFDKTAILPLHNSKILREKTFGRKFSSFERFF